MGGQRETGSAVDAGDETAGGLAGTAHQSGSSTASGLSVFAAGYKDRGAESGVVFGHHVRSYAAGFSVSGGSDGLVQPVRAGLGVVQHVGGAVLRGGVAAGVGDRAAADLQHRPRSTVYQRRVHRKTYGCRDTDQHGWSGSGIGQRDGGATMAQREVRGDLSQGLCRAGKLGLG